MNKKYKVIYESGYDTVEEIVDSREEAIRLAKSDLEDLKNDMLEEFMLNSVKSPAKWSEDEVEEWDNMIFDYGARVEEYEENGAAVWPTGADLYEIDWMPYEELLAKYKS